MAVFKFSYISYDKILESAKGKDMIDAIEQPSDENLLVNGLPGCGKSTIATHRLDKFKNKKGGLLTYGNLLKSYIQQGLEDKNSKNKVFGFWKWFYAHRNNLGLSYIDIKNITGNDFKETFENIVKKQGKYDFLFLDEGQDLPKELYNYLGIIANHISVFADDAQQLYGGKNANVESIINGIDPIQYELNINRRNPRKLYEFALAFNPKNAEKGNLKLMTNKTDPVEIYICENKDSELKQILNMLEEYEGKNIAILFTNADAIDKFDIELKNNNIIGTVYYNKKNNIQLNDFQSPILTTFHSVKGLEFDIVIIPGIYPDIRNPHVNENHFFVAATRASEKLIITHHDGNSEIEGRIKNIDKNLYEKYDIGDTKDEAINIEDIPF